MVRAAVLWLLVRAARGVPRIVPILHGWHFDNLLRDHLAPPPAVLVFYGSSWCQEAFNGFGVSDAAFPTRAHLFVGTYDMDRIHDVWWRGEPRFEERYNLTMFPSVVFLADPRGRPEAFEVWEGGATPWLQWVWERLAFDVEVTNGLAVAADVRAIPGAARARPPDAAAILGIPAA